MRIGRRKRLSSSLLDYVEYVLSGKNEKNI